jgi:protein involved in polysaccharide export with SLBB domain
VVRSRHASSASFRLRRRPGLVRASELVDRSSVSVRGRVQFAVNVLGAVDKPGMIELSRGDRLSMAIAKAGESTAAKGDLNRIMVTRTEPNGTTASHEVDLYRAIERGDIRYDPLLRKDDILYVPLATRPRGVLSSGLFLLRTLVGL